MDKSMVMHSPPHPGELLREDFFEPMMVEDKTLTIIRIAIGLGVSKNTLSNLINCHTGVSPEMAVRLEKAFPNTDAEFWLNLQKIYNLWKAKQETDVKNVVSYPQFQKMPVNVESA